MKNQYRRTPQQWQTDSTQITTDTVQFWSNGSMVSCNMKRDEARLMVDTGNAFVISDTAIGLLYDGRMES